MSHEFRVFERAGDGNPLQCGDTILLSPDNSRYIVQVLRLRPGATIIVVDREFNSEFLGVLAPPLRATEAHCILKHLVISETAKDVAPVSSLLFAICKGDTNDAIVEKASELGVENIIFWHADRSVPKLDSWRRQPRLQRVAEAAASQSGRSSIPTIQVYSSLAEAIGFMPGSRLPKSHHSKPGVDIHERVNLWCSLEPQATPLADLFPLRTKANIVTGPEADLSPRENAILQNAGFTPITLGKCRLRSDTAAIVAIAAVRALHVPL